MQDERIIFQNESGWISVVVPREDIAVDMVKLAEKTVPNGVAYEIVDVSEIPSDRTFRNAWEKSGIKISVNMSRALAIHKDKLRVDRLPELEALDREFMLALEAGADTSGIAAKKQALRDMPADARLAGAKTPGELKALTIDKLVRKGGTA